jgi:hypothetical protein
MDARVIRTYGPIELRRKAEGTQDIPMPRDAIILDLAGDYDREAMVGIAAIVDPEKPLAMRRFRVCKEDAAIPRYPGRYIGNVYGRAFVFEVEVPTVMKD